jgi:putative sigma-54 modulation protein
MDFTISGQHTTLTEAIKDYAEKRMSKLETRFKFPVAVNLRIRKEETKRDEDRFIAEVTIPLKQGFIRSEERAESPYTAIDLVQQTVERRIRRYKARFDKKRRAPSLFETEIASQLKTETVEEGPTEPVVELEFGQVVRTKRYPMVPMSVQDAAAQMDLLGHNFFMFKNDETGEVNVVYRRHDDDYGLIVPEEQVG